jgi:peptidoglycan/LPS O-acetylase OafA/YrhL
MESRAVNRRLLSADESPLGIWHFPHEAIEAEKEINVEIKSTSRFRQLDSLRGISAVFVMLHHFVWTRFDTQSHRPQMPQSFWIGLESLHLLFSGWESVVFFFVLSGVVLTVSIPKRHPLRYGHYVLHRVCRIYLPYLFSLFVAIVGCSLFHDRIPTWTPWVTAIWTHTPRFEEILIHILFLGTYYQKFNTVYWSLIIELRISLLLPFLILAIRRIGLRLALWLVAAMTLADACASRVIDLDCSVVIADWARTAHYALFFIYGIMAMLHWEEVEQLILGLGKTSRLGLFLLSVFTCYYLPVFLNKSLLRTYCNFEFVIAIGATTIVCLAIHDETLAEILTRRPLIWLGRISYSLYLIHMIVMLSLAALLGSRISYICIFFLAVGVSLISAEAMARYVERPSQLLGRRLDAVP